MSAPLEDQFLGPAGHLLTILDWSNIPWHRNGTGWLTRCPLHPETRDALLVTEDHADDCTFRCERGCEESKIRARLRDLELLATASLGANLLDELVAFVRRFVLISPIQAIVVALWVIHTYALEAAEATPYLHASSPEKRSGKTRLLEVLAQLVKAPLDAANISDAALFRAIALKSPTVLFDEIDAVFGPRARDREDLRSLLNAGYRRSAQVWRCVGEGQHAC